MLTNIEYMCLLNSILDGADSSKRSLTIQVQPECQTAKIVAEAKKHLLPLFQGCFPDPTYAYIYIIYTVTSIFMYRNIDHDFF